MGASAQIAERGGRRRSQQSVRAEYELSGFVDEAFGADGSALPPYGEVLQALAGVDLSRLAAEVAAEVRSGGVTFGYDRSPFRTDPVPRIFERDEWGLVEKALRQRVRALGEFVADVYGPRQIVRLGLVPAAPIETCMYFEPWMLGIPLPPWAYVAVAGFDLVRGADGRLAVLEDNLRTPSGLAYAGAVRRVADRCLPYAAPSERHSTDPAYDTLGAALRAAAPDGRGDPSIVLLSDGPANSAWYEHRELARRLGVPLVTPADLYTNGGRLRAFVGQGSREVGVVYRRTDEDRLRDEAGASTWVAQLLLDPCRAGRLGCVNGFGSGVADDKLIHAYVDEMIRFYLGEEPLIESVPTYDLSDPDVRQDVLARVGELVVKPRAGHGGRGIFIGPHATNEGRATIARRVGARPHEWVAQETVVLSRHPTIEGGRLVPRHVDLRAFAICVGEDVTVVPGGLTRFARAEGSLVVNSSQGGGGKDTWVLG